MNKLRAWLGSPSCDRVLFVLITINFVISVINYFR